MSRSDRARLLDIVAACDAIAGYIPLADGDTALVFDAIRMRLVEIGEAVKDLSAATRDREPDLPWDDMSRMRDLLAHRYFDTTHSIVMATARLDTPEVRAAAVRLLA